MSETPQGAQVVEGRTRRGRPCRLIDNTGTLRPETLQALLDDLVAQDQFGALGVADGGVLALDKPRFTHIQLEGRLYRLLLFRYHACIEAF